MGKQFEKSAMLQYHAALEDSKVMTDVNGQSVSLVGGRLQNRAFAVILSLSPTKPQFSLITFQSATVSPFHALWKKLFVVFPQRIGSGDARSFYTHPTISFSWTSSSIRGAVAAYGGSPSTGSMTAQIATTNGKLRHRHHRRQRTQLQLRRVLRSSSIVWPCGCRDL